jgi:hypothetical protein
MTAGALWLASSYEIFTLHQITGAGMKGAAVRVSLQALQVQPSLSYLVQ